MILASQQQLRDDLFHVMAHESFADRETAALMNEHFVNIKVEREERPGLEAIYMQSAVAMSSSGGWPLSVFLAPDLEPFYAGTYFPPARREFADDHDLALSVPALRPGQLFFGLPAH